MSRIVAALKTLLHLQTPPSGEVDDQTYSEAVMENAVREGDNRVERINEVAEQSTASNARLNAAIDKLEVAGGDRHDVMAELVNGMKSRGGVI